MPRIFIHSQSHFPITRKKIKQTILTTLKQQGVESEVEMSVNFVGDRKMADLHQKYLNEKGTTDVLSFPLTPIVGFPREDILNLGDIVISYPQAQRQAAQHNLLVDDEISNLVEHGLLHLLGIHHEE